MSALPVDTNVLWSIVAAQPTLWHVEHFLTHADEPCLVNKLNKLQQDAGLSLQEDLCGDAFETYAQKNSEDAGPGLIASYEPVTQDRLKILTDVQYALEAHGSDLYEGYSNFMTKLGAPLPRVTIEPIGPLPTPSPQ